MAIKFDKIEPGMILLDVHSEYAGHTKIRRLGCWKVLIVSVDKQKRTAVVRWNVCNPEDTWTERDLCRLYVKPPKKYLDQQERRSRGGL